MVAPNFRISFLLAIPVLLLTSEVTRAQEKKALELRPGLVGEYYRIGERMNDFPTLGTRRPVIRRIDAQVNFGPTVVEFAKSGMRDHLYARWSGFLRIPRAGTYTFSVESDDGGRLYLDGKLIVDNGGVHPPHTRRRTARLEAGDHPLRLDFFENDGIALCKVHWKFEREDSSLIPASAFFHRIDPTLDR